MTQFKSGFVTLIGLPNAGKSSLFNKIIGENLAIVTPKAQTTWRLLRGYASFPHMEIVLTDTPGLQAGTKALNLSLARNAEKALAMATEGHEIICFVVDAADMGRRLKEGKPLGFENMKNILQRDCGKNPLKLPVIPILNKADLVRKKEHRAQIEKAVSQIASEMFASPHRPLWLSVTSDDEGISSWLEALYELLPAGEKGSLFDSETLSDQNLREFAAEFIREQCFMQLGDELPYSTAVQIEAFNESDPEITRIEAVLHVEKESQKAVVIGKGGSKIKSIGTKARLKIEQFIGKRVFLGLKVKVTPHWAREQRWVERFGYGERR